VAKSYKAAGPLAPNRMYLIAGIVILLIVGLVVYTTQGSGGTVTTPVPLADSDEELQRARGISMGREDAPVLLYEFADYQCPACAQFSTFAHPLIKERLVDRGIVRLVRYDFPLVMNHRHAFLASRAARCAEEQGRYWEYHDILYGRQPTWAVQRDPSGVFVEYAELAGIDARPFQQCLRSDRHAEEVTRNMRLGEILGVSGTPTLMINGERVRLMDYNDLEAQILEAAGQTPSEAAPVS